MSTLAGAMPERDELRRGRVARARLGRPTDGKPAAARSARRQRARVAGDVDEHRRRVPATGLGVPRDRQRRAVDAVGRGAGDALRLREVRGRLLLAARVRSGSTRLSGAVPPIDGLRSSVRRAVIVTTAGPDDVSTVVGVIASDDEHGRVRVDGGPAAGDRPERARPRPATRAVAIAATTDRRLRATIASRSARTGRASSPIGPKRGRDERPGLDDLLRVP